MNVLTHFKNWTKQLKPFQNNLALFFLSVGQFITHYSIVYDSELPAVAISAKLLR